MINYRYKEEEYARKIEQDGFVTDYIKREIILLIKYWKSKGHKPKKRKEMTYDFCRKHIENFNEVKYFRTINSVLRIGGSNKNPLINIDVVPITAKELEFIDELNIEYNLKKFLFTLLVEAKLRRSVHWLKYDKQLEHFYLGGSRQRHKELFDISKIPKKYKINEVVNIFENMGLVDVRTKAKFKLVFMNKIEESEKVVFNVDSFGDIGWHYDLHYGENRIMRCEECDILIRKNSNSQKYCHACWREYRNNYQKELMRKIRGG